MVLFCDEKFSSLKFVSKNTFCCSDSVCLTMADMHAPNEGEDFITTREFGWMENSSLEISLDDIDGELNQDIFEYPQTPIARHGPIIHADPLEIKHQRQFWYQCALGFILDYKRFTVHHLQQTINNAWTLKDRMTVVGREAYFYVLHFESQEDLMHVCEGIWILSIFL